LGAPRLCLFVTRLDLGTSSDDLLGATVLVLLEVLLELDGEGLSRLEVVIFASLPDTTGVQDSLRNTGARLRNSEVEDRVVLVLNLSKLSRVDSVQDSTSVLERTTLSSSRHGLSGPSSVDEPGIGSVLLDLLGQHLGVAHGVKSQEGLSETCGEGGGGLGNSLLGTGHLGGVSGDEVVGDGLGGELGDGGKDTGGIASKKDKVLGVVVGDTGDLDVGDVLDGVSTTGVLSKSDIVVVDLTGLRVEDNVLKDRSEADGVVNVGLLLGGETNALGVTSSLDVEDTGVGPAVLVVSDQGTVGVGREGGLSGSRQSEEESNISVLSLVGRGVEGQDVVLDGHLVEENSEDTLLHLSGVLGSENDHLLLGEVDSNGSGRGHSSGESVGGERSSVVDSVVGLEVDELLRLGADQHVAHEESVVGTGANNTDVDAVTLIPSGKSINDVDTVAGVEVVDGTLTVDTPDLCDVVST
jgi:hypothetical protein